MKTLRGILNFKMAASVKGKMHFTESLKQP